MCFSCQSNTFPSSKQSNFDNSLLNSGFHNVQFSSSTNILSNENLIFLLNATLKTPFNDSDHHIAIDFKYYDMTSIYVTSSPD